MSLTSDRADPDPEDPHDSQDVPASPLEARFEIERKLGQGGAGAVFLVRDRDSGERLALKQLLRMDMKSVLRLKHEFRALADLHHPNLIKLYELGRATDAWFITMEYLSGTDLLMHLASEANISTTMRRGEPANDVDEHGQLAKLSAAFQQLAHGIRALHRAGMLHRDLKPSNVMVASDRVVVLDFGLVRELGDNAATVTQDEMVAGTPAYMAPEQVQGAVLTQATDWYAFGVMLYQALSGELPLQGKLMELLRAKLEDDPTPIDRLVRGLPNDLSALCMALLQRDPNVRPTFDQIIEVLAPLNPSFEPSTQTTFETQLLVQTQQHVQPTTLAGRTRELAQLDSAFSSVLRGEFVVAHVRGPSGAGKSALVDHFLESLEFQSGQAGGHDLLLLRSRCYEREAMPFKALDGLMDTLVSHLARETDVVASHMLPTHLPELARAFPVLERLPAVQRLLEKSRERGDATRERSRAEQALRELLRRVAAHKAVVLWIDDLQWGDLDSVSILKSWLSSGETLPVLLLLSYRSDELETNACLNFLAQREPSPSVVEQVIDVPPLTASEVEALCVQRLGADAQGQTELIAHIVLEAEGSPFLVSQLLILARAKISQGEHALDTLSIDGLLTQASALLAEPARALLNVLAVAGRPMTLRPALRAARIRRDGRSQLHALRSLGLTRMRVAAGRHLLEVYHDRVREAVLAALRPTERIDIHRRLLAALELSGKADVDWLYVIARGADERAAALRYGLLAADRAAASLAFERAAALYRECLELSDASAANSCELWLKLARALAHSGHGSRAADAYLAAAKRSAPEQSVELLRVAATHMLRCGRFAEGEALVVEVLAAMGLRVPTSEAGLIAAIGWERARLSVRGLDFTQRRLEDVDSTRVAHAFAYGSLSIDTQAYDPLRAALFQARCLRLALDTSDSRTIASALCATAVMRCGVSGSARAARYADDLLERAHELAERIGSPLARARVSSARAMCAFLQGRLVATVTHAAEAQLLYRANTDADSEMAGEYYHRFAVAAARVGALFQLGELRQASAELQLMQDDARATENLTALLHLTMVSTLDDITAGKAERARTRLIEEQRQLPEGSFGPLHLLHMVAVMRVGCSLGDHAWALNMTAEAWPRFERSMVRHSVLAHLAHGAHLRLLFNQHVVEKRAGVPRALIRRDLRAMARLSPQLSAATRTRFEARLAYLAGQLDRALELCREHVQLCIQKDYRDEIARGNYALGRLLGGSEGRQLCSQAEHSLGELGVVDPMADLAAHFPEFFLAP